MLSSENSKVEIKKRVFFALWPDDITRSEVFKACNYSAFSQLNGRKFNSDNLHLTLHFLGNVTDNQFDCALNAAAQIKFKAFDLSLDYFDVFKKPKVLWMGCSELPSALKSLHENLGQGLSACGLVLDERAFSPHVTLMRKLKQFEFDVKPSVINWQVNEFALVESVTSEKGVIYKPIKFFSCSV